MQILKIGDSLKWSDHTCDLCVAHGYRETESSEGYYWASADGDYGCDVVPHYARASLGEPSTAPPRMIIGQDGVQPQILRGRHRESKGRLRYIDGCSDTVLIYPPKKGDPCLNFLHIPPGIKQTMHTHPSPRVGMVIGGYGEAVLLEDERVPLTPGCVWFLATDEWHRFETTDSHLDIIAFHPDSDWGPSDETHPMKNRTMVNDRPVAQLIASGEISVEQAGA